MFIIIHHNSEENSPFCFKFVLSFVLFVSFINNNLVGVVPNNLG